MKLRTVGQCTTALMLAESNPDYVIRKFDVASGDVAYSS